MLYYYNEELVSNFPYLIPKISISIGLRLDEVTINSQ